VKLFDAAKQTASPMQFVDQKKEVEQTILPIGAVELKLWNYSILMSYYFFILILQQPFKKGVKP